MTDKPNGDCQALGEDGFSLIELLIAMVITLIILSAAVMVYSSALSSRIRESSRADAITSAKAALNLMSREIGNAGFGLSHNGLGWYDGGGWRTDCTDKFLRVRANVGNADGETSGAGEDVAYYFDAASQSVVRYDINTGQTSGVINRVSNVTFNYENYVNRGSSTTGPSPDTGKVTITLTVTLQHVPGQPAGQRVTVSSDVTLRNSPYMLGQY